jgi:hypothetical protein
VDIGWAGHCHDEGKELMATAPSSKATGQAIVTFLQGLTYPNTSIPIYQVVQLEQIKDVIAIVGGGGVCGEVYGYTGSSDHKAFGGTMWKEQSWHILSLCSLDSPTLAQTIYDVSDAFEALLGSRFELGATIDGLFYSAFVAGSGRHTRIQRNGQYVRAYLVEAITRQQYQVTLNP